MHDTLTSEGNTFNGVDFQVLFTLVRLFSTHRKSQITSWQQALSNIGSNESYRMKRVSELGFTMSGREASASEYWEKYTSRNWKIH